jgi:hypothetical protein
MLGPVPLFEPVFDALDGVKARFVIVGGLATVLHGYARLTADVDLVIDLAPEPARRAIDALLASGLVVRAPVDARRFADADERRSWVDEKGMRALSFWDPTNPMLEVDILADPPIPFDELWSRAEIVHLERSDVRIASIADLIAMKQLAGRPEDLLDIEASKRSAAAGRRSVAGEPNPDWGSWDENRRRKLTRGLDATPAQRLAWLEAAIRLAFASGALPNRRQHAAEAGLSHPESPPR